MHRPAGKVAVTLLGRSPRGNLPTGLTRPRDRWNSAFARETRCPSFRPSRLVRLTSGNHRSTLPDCCCVGRGLRESRKEPRARYPNHHSKDSPHQRPAWPDYLRAGGGPACARLKVRRPYWFTFAERWQRLEAVVKAGQLIGVVRQAKFALAFGSAQWDVRCEASLRIGVRTTPGSTSPFSR